jgi:cytochrome c oxidase subunit 3
MAADPLAPAAPQFADGGQRESAATLGMWVFLATEVLFFGVLFGSYSIVRFLNYEAFVLGSHQTHVVLGTLNTGLLLTSSLTMAMAVRGSTLGRRHATTLWLVLTLVLGITFLGIKAVEYHQEYLDGLVPALAFHYDGPHAQGVMLFFYLYFVMTGLHALHLIIGVSLVAVMAVRNARGHFGPGYHTPVQLTGLYWDFVDIVWVFLYPLFYLVARA